MRLLFAPETMTLHGDRNVSNDGESTAVHDADKLRSVILNDPGTTGILSRACNDLRGRNTQTFTWPHILHSLIDRYLTDTELQNAYDRVTLIAQRTNETENEYADRISEAARDCANLFEDHALVHYYVRGLLQKTFERVIEDLRRQPEKERHDLKVLRRLAMAQGNTYRAQIAAVARAASTQTQTRPRTPTLCVTEHPMRDRTVPHLPGFERIGMLSDF